VCCPDASARGSAFREARAGLGEDQERAPSDHPEYVEPPVPHTLRGNTNILRGNESNDMSWIPPALLLVVNGFPVLVALSALVSIWFGRTGGD